MWMQQGSRVERWNHTSHILAMLHNTSPNATEGRQPWQYHPYDPRYGHSPPVPKGEITDLICMLPTPEKRKAARERARQAREWKKARGE